MDGQKNRSMAKDLSDITFDTWTHQKRVKRMQRQINCNQEKWLSTSNRFRTMALNAQTSVAEVAREHGGHPPKSLGSDENFKPEHTLFCRELRFVAIYALFFGELWA